MVKYEVKRNDTDQIMGTLWWDGKKIQASAPNLLSLIEDSSANGYSIKDGKDFFDHLPYAFKNGYVSLRKFDG